MLLRFIMFLFSRAYNSLGDPTRSLKKITCFKIQTDLKAFVTLPPLSDQLICKFFEGIWNNYVDIQQKNMQVRFIIISRSQGAIRPCITKFGMLTCLNANQSKMTKPIS